jgi:aconitate hydratase
MAENLVTKILREHMVDGSLEPGEEVGLRIDQTLLQDATGTMGLPAV